MVRVIRQEQSEYERLDGLIAQLAQKHGLKLDRTGWSRKTNDLFLHDRAADRSLLVARVETLATVNGEVRVFDDRGLPFVRGGLAPLRSLVPLGVGCRPGAPVGTPSRIHQEVTSVGV